MTHANDTPSAVETVARSISLTTGSEFTDYAQSAITALASLAAWGMPKCKGGTCEHEHVNDCVYFLTTHADTLAAMCVAKDAELERYKALVFTLEMSDAE